MDAWLVLLSRLGVPTASFAMVGRWVGNMRRGQFAHVAITKAPLVRNELALGLADPLCHRHRLRGAPGRHAGRRLARAADVPARPGVGVATVAAPWFVMQPAMGAGFLATKTPTPLKNCLRSLANHAVFGAGLYLAAAGLASVVA